MALQLLPNKTILLSLVLHHLGIHVGYSSPEHWDFRTILREDSLLPCDYGFYTWVASGQISMPGARERKMRLLSGSALISFP